MAEIFFSYLIYLTENQQIRSTPLMCIKEREKERERNCWQSWRADEALPKSPKWAASMWLGCFLRAAVRLLENESMLAEMALIATWLGPAASSKAWFLVLLWGECTGPGAGIKTAAIKRKGPSTISMHYPVWSTPRINQRGCKSITPLGSFRTWLPTWAKRARRISLYKTQTY